MAKETLHELMLEELADIYDAEHQITKALPKMIAATTSSELKQSFELHLKQTEGQISRLEQVFESLGEKAERKACKAMKGLVAEGDDLIKDHEKSGVLDAALVGAAQRIEHYEMAAYGTARAYAEAMGHTEVAQMLEQTLNEEKKTDKLLTQIGEKINHECAADKKMSGMKGKR